jgi:hypothetical protein
MPLQGSCGHCHHNGKPYKLFYDICNSAAFLHAATVPSPHAVLTGASVQQLTRLTGHPHIRDSQQTGESGSLSVHCAVAANYANLCNCFVTSVTAAAGSCIWPSHVFCKRFAPAQAAEDHACFQQLPSFRRLLIAAVLASAAAAAAAVVLAAAGAQHL